MKILVYQHIVVMGGAERYLLTLLPELKKRQLDVGFYCTLQKNNAGIVEYFTKHFQAHNIPVHICTTNLPFGLQAAVTLAKTIKTNKYTILHTHLMHAEITSAFAMLVYRPNCKLVLTKHGYLQGFMDVYGLDASKINKLKPSYQVEKIVQRFVTKNFAVSKGLAQFYLDIGICQPSKMAVIPHGMTASPLEAVDSTTEQETGITNLLVIGRLKRLKGHHFLIEALQHLKKERSDFKLVILGAGEEQANLELLIQEYQLETVVSFAGYSDHVDGFFKATDIVVVPSMAEAFGLVVLEAYNFCKPVIAFDVTALNENIIDGKTGLLVPPFDINKLAEAIRFLMDNSALKNEMGQNGRQELTTHYLLSDAITKTIDFYLSVS